MLQFQKLREISQLLIRVHDSGVHKIMKTDDEC